MSLGNLLLGIWLILVGANWLTWLTVDIKFLGLLAFVTGIILFVEGFHPITIFKRQ